MSLRKISAKLAEPGHLNERGRPFNPRSVKTTVERYLGVYSPKVLPGPGANRCRPN